jgi:hypothetical protein
MKNLRTARLALPFALVIAACGTAGSGGDTGDAGTDAGAGADAGTPMTASWSSLYTSYLQDCKSCHAPNASGRTGDTETTLDFSSAGSAYATVTTGKAAGLVGNQSACNSVPFIVSGHPEQSLLVASIDFATRTTYASTTAPTCDSTAVTDQTAKQGMVPPAGYVSALKQWITDGAPNN